MDIIYFICRRAFFSQPDIVDKKYYMSDYAPKRFFVKIQSIMGEYCFNDYLQE